MKVHQLADDKNTSIWRLENKRSNLGPYEHGGQIPKVLREGVHNSVKVLGDIDTDALDPKIRYQLDVGTAKFAFSSLAGLIKFIKNIDVLYDYGFVIVEYEAGDYLKLFESDDGQVIFTTTS